MKQFENREGQRIPQVSFKTRVEHEWVDITTDEIFSGKNVIVFSLPGAFTPTCSSSHVPRYNQLAPLFRQRGIDEVVCVSVNDAFVMNEWCEQQEADQIRFLPDGTGEFTDKMGLLVDRSDLGFGMRSWRYSMLVRDGVIEKMFIEPDEPGDPFHVSDADTMLDYLSPAAERPLDVVVLSRPGCPHCVRAKQALTKAGIGYEELSLNRDFRAPALRAFSGAGTVPQVFINGERIGGADELEAWLKERAAA